MKRRDWLEKWGLSSLKLNIGFATGEFKPRGPDRAAARDLYVDLRARITTQYHPPEDGDEQPQREILRKHGSYCGDFAKLAIPVLNLLPRQFTDKMWVVQMQHPTKTNPSANAHSRSSLHCGSWSGDT